MPCPLEFLFEEFADALLSCHNCYCREDGAADRATVAAAYGVSGKYGPACCAWTIRPAGATPCVSIIGCMGSFARVNVIARVDAIGAALRNGESESCHERVLARFLLNSDPAAALPPELSKILS